MNLLDSTHKAARSDAPAPVHPPAGRRRHERHAAGWPAICTERGGLTWQSSVVDYSHGGLGLDRCPPIAVGRIITVDLFHIGRFACRVAWGNDSGRVGVEFARNPAELSDDQVMSLSFLLSSLHSDSASSLNTDLSTEETLEEDIQLSLNL